MLEAARARRARREDFERDKEALLEYHARLVPDDLDGLTPEQTRTLYRMIRLKVLAYDGVLTTAEWGCNDVTTLRCSSAVTTNLFRFRTLLAKEGFEVEMAPVQPQLHSTARTSNAIT